MGLDNHLHTKTTRIEGPLGPGSGRRPQGYKRDGIRLWAMYCAQVYGLFPPQKKEVYITVNKTERIREYWKIDFI